MTSALAWVAFPLVTVLVALGAGLVAERLSRHELPVALVAPLGACVCVLLVRPVYLLGGTAAVAAAILVVVVLAGLALARGRLRRRHWGGPAIAALAAYGLYMAPVLLSGHWTWGGYNVLNDTSVNFLMTDQIAHHGDVAPAYGHSTAGNLISNTLATGYPLGIHALLASLNWLVPLPLAAVYQPFIATLAALAAMAFIALGRRCGLPQLVAAVAAVAAIGATLTYQYALHGSFKEIALMMMLATAAAAARVALDARLRPGAVAVVAIPLASGIAVFSLAAAAYAVALGALMLVLPLWVEDSRPSWAALGRASAAGVGVLLVAAAPFLHDAVSFGRGAAVAYSSSGQIGGVNPGAVLGHLVRPLPPYQALGIWPRDDYRFPLHAGLVRTATGVALVVVALLIVTAVAVEVRRRRWGATLALVPVALVYFAAAPRLSPYAEAKLLVVAAPMAVFAAALGAWWLSRRLWPAGVAAAAVLLVGIGASNAMAYHFVRLAPTDRMESLADAAAHARGGPWLSTEWEEFAKWFGRRAQLNVAPESDSPLPADLRVPGPIFGRSLDLDELKLPYVQRWTGAILRRGPTTSRPPASFSEGYQNAYYEVWRRDPRVRVMEHLPLLADRRRGGVPRCADVRAIARRAGPSERLVAAPAPAMPTLDPSRAPLKPPRWGAAPTPGSVVPRGAGRVIEELGFAAGSYHVWIRGSSERPVSVLLDGRRVGSPAEVNTPAQWLDAGRVRVAPGRHEVTLALGGRNLAPGDGFRGEVGPVVFEPGGPRRLTTVAPRDGARLCGRAWDWIERVASS